MSEAVANGHAQVVRILIECGADFYSPDSLGRTPIFTAMSNMDLESMGLLISTGHPAIVAEVELNVEIIRRLQAMNANSSGFFRQP